jgi:hypothetical protein
MRFGPFDNTLLFACVVVDDDDDVAGGASSSIFDSFLDEFISISTDDFNSMIPPLT